MSTPKINHPSLFRIFVVVNPDFQTKSKFNKLKCQQCHIRDNIKGLHMYLLDAKQPIGYWENILENWINSTQICVYHQYIQETPVSYKIHQNI